MSEIVKTEAVVLRSMKYLESSKIVTLYTRNFGKVSTIVKGARQPKSKFGSSLEPMSYVSVVFYKKEGRDLQTLSQCDVLQPFRMLSEDLGKMSVGLAIIEIVNAIAHDEEKNIPLFNLVIGVLTALNEAEKNFQSLLYAFEIHLSRILGFQPVFDRCISCDRPVGGHLPGEDEITFSLDRGGPQCGDCSGTGGRAFLVARRNLITLQRIVSISHLPDVCAIDIQKEDRAEIGDFLWTYLYHHVSGMRSLRSEKIFAAILTDS